MDHIGGLWNILFQQTDYFDEMLLMAGDPDSARGGDEIPENVNPFLLLILRDSFVRPMGNHPDFVSPTGKLFREAASKTTWTSWEVMEIIKGRD